MKNRLMVLILLGSLIMAGLLFLIVQPAYGFRQRTGFYPIAIHSASEADYSADPVIIRIAAVSIGLIVDVMRDESQPEEDITARLATITAALQTGVPTVTLPAGSSSFPTIGDSPTPTQTVEAIAYLKPTYSATALPDEEDVQPTQEHPSPTPSRTVSPTASPVRSLTPTTDSMQASPTIKTKTYTVSPTQSPVFTLSPTSSPTTIRPPYTPTEIFPTCTPTFAPSASALPTSPPATTPPLPPPTATNPPPTATLAPTSTATATQPPPTATNPPPTVTNSPPTAVPTIPPSPTFTTLPPTLTPTLEPTPLPPTPTVKHPKKPTKSP